MEGEQTLVKEVKVFETSDGTTFKTKKGAENHEKKLAAKEVMNKFGLTKEEVQEKLEERAHTNNIIRSLLNTKEWTDWAPNLIKQIDEGALNPPQSKTKYILEGEVIEDNKAEEFDDYEVGDLVSFKSINGEPEYKVVGVEEPNKYTKELYLDYTQSYEKRLKDMIDNGETLSEGENAYLAIDSSVEYEEEGDARRWSTSVITVVNLCGELYAVEWEKGLTEQQPNMFSNQPYKVALEQEEVTYTTIETTIRPV